MDPKNPIKLQSKNLKFDFASIRDKKFENENKKYRNSSIMKTLKNNLKDESYQKMKEHTVMKENKI